ncbi:MAG: GNAT family N-acetyltransferase [Betaproteobacteria bacterium]
MNRIRKMPPSRRSARDPSIRKHGAIDVRMFVSGDAARVADADAALIGGVDAVSAAALAADPTRHVAIALDGRRVVGIAFATHRAGPRGEPELIVSDLTVAPSHRRRGVGRRLLALLLAHGRALGCSEASAEAERDNAAILALCAAAGGVEVPDPQVRVSFALD